MHRTLAYTLTIIIFSALLIILPQTTQAQKNIEASIEFSKPFYYEKDNFNLKINLVNKTASPLDDLNIRVNISDNGDIIYSFKQELSNLARKEIVIKKSFKEMEMKAGVYPVSIKIDYLDQTIVKYSTAIAVLDKEKRKPLLLSLLFDFHAPPQLDSQNRFSKKKLTSLLDQLLIYSEVIKTSPKSVYLAFSPLLLEDIRIVANEAGMPPDLAKKAQFLLNNYRQLTNSKKVNIVATSYSRAPLNLLSYLKWKTDINEQAQASKTVTEFFGSRSPNIFYSYNGYINLSAVRKLSRLYRYSFISSNSTEDYTFRPHKLGNQKIFFVDKRASNNLGQNPEASVEKAFARLGYIYSDDNKQKAIVISVTSMTNPKTIELFLKKINEVPWIRLANIEELKKSPTLKGLTVYSTKRHYNQKYLKALRLTRQKYWLFSKAVGNNNETLQTLKKLFLKAQDLYYLTKTTADNSLLKKITNTIETELAKISLKSSPIILTSASGKVPVSILNKTDYDITLKLKADAKNFFFEEESNKIKLKPGENLFILSVTALKSGSHPINLYLYLNSKAIKKSSVLVKANVVKTFNYYLLGIGASIVVLLIGALILREVRFRRKNGR